MKRGFDITAALFLLVTLFPVLLAIALAIRIESSGPALFCQVRRGKNGLPFRMLKFRTMRADAEKMRAKYSSLNEAERPLFKISRDPRMTRVGQFLRRWCLDELPQLIHVLRGEMSLVGPRPLDNDDLMDFLGPEKNSAWLKEREMVCPGITGLWQVRGRCEHSYQKMRTQDRYYVRKWSLLLDLKILAETFPVILSGRGVL